MRPLVIAALVAAALPAAALPAAAQTAPAAPAPAPSMSTMPRADGGGYGGMRTPPTPQMRAARQSVRQQCQADMARLCADVMQAPPQAPAGAADGAGGGGGRRGGMMQCIRQHRSEVSPSCSQALDAMRAARKAGGAPPAGGAAPPEPQR